VVYGLDSIVFVVDALWSRWGGEVFMGSLAVVSCWQACGEWHGASDIFELERVYEWLQAVGHGLRRVWVDDEYGAHFAVSGITAGAIFAH
jgi:hypothetical protein